MECAGWLSACPALCTAENTTTFSHHSLLEYEITAHYTVKGNPGQGANCINFAISHGLFWEVSAKNGELCTTALHFSRNQNFPQNRNKFAPMPHRMHCEIRNRATPHKSARESDERFFVRKRCKTAGILCVFQGFTNAFLAEKIRQNPQTHLCGVALKERTWTDGRKYRKAAGSVPGV